MTNGGMDMAKGDTLFTAGGSADWYSHYGSKSVWLFFKKLDIDQLCDAAVSLLGINPNDVHLTTEIFIHPCS